MRTTRAPDPVRVRLDLAYDGAGYAGFARQPEQRTVQGELEAALAAVLGQPALTTAAGRTDRGVHALAQVVHLDVDPTVVRARPLLVGRELGALRERLARLLEPSITLWQATRVGAGFDARFSAVARGYRYRLVDDLAACDPRRRGEQWVVAEPLVLSRMRAAARYLLGEHDFAALCRRAPGRSTVRRLDEVALHRPGPGRLDVRLRGPAFCHQQVRSILGCLVEVGRGRRDPDWLREVLAGRDRSRAARVAPPQGLTLEQVSYGRRWPAAPPRWVAT